METQGTSNQENVNQQFNQQFGQQFGQMPLPNATAVLVLGIISIPVCFCYFLFGIPTIVLSVISLVLSAKAKKMYEANPSLYTIGSYNNLKAGRVCAIVGLSIAVLYIIFVVVLFAIVGSAMTAAPWEAFGRH